LRSAWLFVNGQSKRRKLACAASLVFAAAFIAGMHLGRDASPVVKTDSQAIIFLANHFEREQDSKDTKLTLATDVFVWNYSLKQNRVTRTTRPLDELVELKLPTRALADNELAAFDDITQLMTPEAIGVVGTAGVWGSVEGFAKTMGDRADAIAGDADVVVRPLTGPERLLTYAVGTVIMGSGGYLGYKLTYTDKPEFDESVFTKTLNDAQSWHTFAEELRNCDQKIAIDRSLAVLREDQQFTNDHTPLATDATIDPHALSREFIRCRKLNQRLSQRVEAQR
jgi:hypothetical protein